MQNNKLIIGVSGGTGSGKTRFTKELIKRCDSDNIVQHVSVNALDTGRNAHEVLRTLQAIKTGGLTGCEWQPGDEFVG